MKLNTLKTVAAAAATAVVVSLSPALAQDSDLQRILDEKVVRVGAVEAYPSYRQDLASGEWEGIYPEIVEALFSQIGVEVEFVPTEWGTAAAGLQSGRFDLIGGFSARPERALVVAFTDPVAQVPVGVAFSSEENASLATNWDSLNNSDVRIAVADGSATMRMVQKMAPNATFVPVKTEDAAILELESDRVDFFASTESSLTLYGRARADAVTVNYPEPKIGQDSGFALRKAQPEFQDWLTVSLNSMVSDGTIPAIRSKFLNPQE
ncbi:substrate-binding periplasmic protein [Salipiger marinus]|uniref:Polar amino acid transport system substrate-binding protein n=1 Tax=Salipiger marinus TaxID=555512 RepID=A0A1G8UHD4_9RHOB|nr:transporter substrate-binding domain-containing protein [Salipiger marinus]SDJ53266.1 polar amino acid transport system substrate-binding protein [Salipiger marinus]